MINPELELKTNGDGESISWIVPENLNYLEGHFPGFPVLPGVATIDITLEVIRRSLGVSSIRLKKLKRAKFLQPIHPGQRIEIQMSSLENAEWKATWKTSSASGEQILVAELSLSLTLGR